MQHTYKIVDVLTTRLLPSGEKGFLPAQAVTELIMQEAQQLGMSAEIIPQTDILKLQYKDHIEYVQSHTPSTTTLVGRRACVNKQDTRTFLQQAGLSIVKGFPVIKDDPESIYQEIWSGLKPPIVVKPTEGTHGEGVKLNINTYEEMISYCREYFTTPAFKGGLLIEEMFHGTEYRIIATRDKMLSVTEKVPGFVIGDGQHSIPQLIDIKNLDPMRNISEDVYPHIKVDDDMVAILKTQTKELTSIPAAGENVRLRNVSNIMAGGEAIDRTDEAHASVAEIATQIVRAIPGLSWAGIDFMTKDLTSPQNPDSYTVIEVNSAPEFDFQHFPMQGTPRNISFEFIKLMFPEVQG